MNINLENIQQEAFTKIVEKLEKQFARDLSEYVKANLLPQKFEKHMIVFLIAEFLRGKFIVKETDSVKEE